MNLRNVQTEEIVRRGAAYYQARSRPDTAQNGQSALSRRQFLRAAAGATVLGVGLGVGLWRPRLIAALANGSPVPIPGGTPVVGGAFHVFGPGIIDPADAEPSTITDFNGFVGLTYVSGTVRRKNMKTGEVRILPFVESDMRFMTGEFRGTDGQTHQGTFGFV